MAAIASFVPVVDASSTTEHCIERPASPRASGPRSPVVSEYVNHSHVGVFRRQDFAIVLIARPIF